MNMAKALKISKLLKAYSDEVADILNKMEELYHQSENMLGWVFVASEEAKKLEAEGKEPTLEDVIKRVRSLDKDFKKIG